MLHVMVGKDKVPVPRDVESQGPRAVGAFIEAQQARVDAESEPVDRRPRRGRVEA